MSDSGTARADRPLRAVRDERGRVNLPSVEPSNVIRIAIYIVAGIFLFILLGTLFGSLKKTPQDKIGISYGGGPIEGQHFQRIVEPSHGLFINGFADHLYLYPVTQRNYIISGREGEGDVEGDDQVTGPSSDRIPVDFQIAVYFKLNTDKLRKFHEQIGVKYKAYTDGGWERMLNDSFRQQIEFAIQRESRKYEVGALYANSDVLRQIQVDVGTTLQQNVNEILGDDYFCGPQFEAGSNECPQFEFVVKHVDIPTGVKEAFERNRTSEIAVLTKQNEIAQRKAEADAIRELNAALNAAGQNYVLLRAIESGKVDFWVIPQGQDVTLQTPPRSP